MRTHCVIPDLQIRPGVSTKHLKWIGNYIAEKRPDVIVQIGDAADMESISTHGRKLQLEGKRYRKDIDSVKRGMDYLLEPIMAAKGYNPRLVLTLGNHEDRITRYVADHPEVEGAISIEDLGYRDMGWQVVPYLKPIEIDGISYAHYFVSGAYGKPVSSAAALLKRVRGSAVMGHVQTTDIAFHQYTQHFGLFVGICYLHHEAYLTPQGNSTRRQIVMLHEVKNGVADPMFVSLDFLRRKFA